MSDVAPVAEDRKSFRLLGAIGLVLGLLSTSRMVVELYQTRHLRAVPAYYTYLAYDFLLAIAAGVNGAALLRNRGWSTASSTVTATALFIRSALILLDSGRTYLSLLLEGGVGRDPVISFVIASRLLLYATEALYGPILAGFVYIDLQCREATPKEKRRFWWLLGAAALACAGAEILLRLVPATHLVDY